MEKTFWTLRLFVCVLLECTTGKAYRNGSWNTDQSGAKTELLTHTKEGRRVNQTLDDTMTTFDNTRSNAFSRIGINILIDFTQTLNSSQLLRASVLRSDRSRHGWSPKEHARYSRKASLIVGAFFIPALILLFIICRLIPVCLEHLTADEKLDSNTV